MREGRKEGRKEGEGERDEEVRAWRKEVRGDER